MKREPLSSLVDDVDQCNPEELGRPRITYLDISSVDNGTKRLIDPKRIAADAAPSRARQLLHADDVLVSTVRPNLNAVALVPAEFHGEIASTGFCVLRSQPKQLCPRYLFYFTQSVPFVTHLTTTATGASYPAVTDTDILETCIPLPELSEQRRIAGRIEQADRLRRARRYALELTDTFLPAAFLEFFGNPVTNSMDWEVCALEELGDLDRGRSKHRPRNAPELLGGPYPLIQTGDVANSSGYIRTYKQTYSALGLQQSRMWPKGTLCITIAANIAKTGILMFDACFPDSVVGFTPNRKTNTEYVQLWLSFVQKHLERTAPESAQKNINLEILRGLRVPLPPLKLQEEFAVVVQKVECLRAVQREALRQAEHLFSSLLYRAFTG
jgi:type I restriction enzyme S subunit